MACETDAKMIKEAWSASGVQSARLNFQGPTEKMYEERLACEPLIFIFCFYLACDRRILFVIRLFIFLFHHDGIDWAAESTQMKYGCGIPNLARVVRRHERQTLQKATQGPDSIFFKKNDGIVNSVAI